MKEIRTEDAVGHILCHDITQIIKDEKKGVLFKKGHVVKEEDIPLLLSVGKNTFLCGRKNRGFFTKMKLQRSFTKSVPETLPKYMELRSKKVRSRWYQRSMVF